MVTNTVLLTFKFLPSEGKRLNIDQVIPFKPISWIMIMTGYHPYGAHHTRVFGFNQTHYTRVALEKYF